MDPEVVLRSLYRELQLGALRLARSWNRKGRPPNRAALAASREFRVASEAVLALGPVGAPDADFERLVDELSGRMAAVREREADGFVPPLRRERDEDLDDEDALGNTRGTVVAVESRSIQDESG